MRSTRNVVATEEHANLGHYSDPPMLVLASLANGPKHGYAMIEDIVRLCGTRLGPGTLYGAIVRLEQQGWIKPLPPEERRRPYRITAEGVRVLRAKLTTLRQFTKAGLERLEALRIPGSLTCLYACIRVLGESATADSNRDLHMLQVTRGAEFPLVTVRTRLPESAAASATINADLEIHFVGQTTQYKQVPLKVETPGGETPVTGAIPATLSDFKIDPPSLLTMPVKNDIPVRVELTWRQQ